jgi:hypothetical protein
VIPSSSSRGLVALASIALLYGCKRHADSGVLAAAESAAPAASSAPLPPVAHLGPNELPPGTASAFGLVLPRGMKLFANFDKQAEAIGPLRPEEVANYVRDHVSSSRIELGAVGTVFPAVHVKGGDSTKTLRIEVVPLGGHTKVIVKDITPPAMRVEIDPNETDEMRWQKAGYNKDGTLRDRLKLK